MKNLIITFIILSFSLLLSCSKDGDKYKRSKPIEPQLTVSGLVKTDASGGNANKAYINMPISFDLMLENSREGQEIGYYVKFLSEATGGQFSCGGQEIVPESRYSYKTSCDNDVLKISFIPTETEIYNISIAISTDNFVTIKTVDLIFEGITPIFGVEYIGVPEYPEIERPFNFKLNIKQLYDERENSSGEIKVKASAKFTKGSGVVLLGNETLALEKSEDIRVYTGDETQELEDMVVGENDVTVYTTSLGEAVIEFQLQNEYGQSQFVILPTTINLPVFDFELKQLNETIYKNDRTPIEIAINTNGHPTNTYEIKFDIAQSNNTNQTSLSENQTEKVAAVTLKNEQPASARISPYDQAQQPQLKGSEKESQNTKAVVGKLRDTIYIPVTQTGEHIATFQVKDKFAQLISKEIKLNVSDVSIIATATNAEGNLQSEFKSEYNKSIPFTLHLSDNKESESFTASYKIEKRDAGILGGGTLKIGDKVITPETPFTIGKETSFTFIPTKTGNCNVSFTIRTYTEGKETSSITFPIAFLTDRGEASLTLTPEGNEQLSLGEPFFFTVLVNEIGYEGTFQASWTVEGISGTATCNGEETSNSFTIENGKPAQIAFRGAEAGTGKIIIRVYDTSQGTLQAEVPVTYRMGDGISIDVLNYEPYPASRDWTSITIRLTDKTETGTNRNILAQWNSDKIFPSPYETFLMQDGDEETFKIKPFPEFSGPLTITFTTSVGSETISKVITINIPAEIEAIPSGYGTVSGGGCYTIGSSCQLEATPEQGCLFGGWYKNGQKVSDNLIYSFTVTENNNGEEYQALFTPVEYEILGIDIPDEGGSVTGLGKHEYKSNVRIIAYPTANYEFDYFFDGTNRITENPYRFTMPASNVFLETYFKLKTFEITANAQGYGTVTGGGTYEAGSTCVLRATPQGGVFKGWYENGALVSSAQFLSFKVTSARNLTAVFEAANYRVSITNDKGGESVTGEGEYPYNSPVEVSATPISKAKFYAWYDTFTGELISRDNPYRFTMPAEPVYLRAVYEFEDVTITVSCDETMGTVTGGGTFEFGDIFTIKAVPNSNYDFAGWYENGILVHEEASWTDGAYRDINVVAKFVLTKYKVIATESVEPLGGLIGTFEGAGEYEYGSTATLKASDWKGHQFVCWAINAQDKYYGEKIISLKITGDIFVAPLFTYKSYPVKVMPAEGGRGYLRYNGGYITEDTYDYGSNITISAEPETGWVFDHWQKNGERYRLSEFVWAAGEKYMVNCPVVVDTLNEFTPVFMRISYFVGMSYNKNMCEVTDYGDTRHGGTVTLVLLNVYPGYRFVGWLDKETNQIVSTDTTYSFIITSSRDFEAVCEAT